MLYASSTGGTCYLLRKPLLDAYRCQVEDFSSSSYEGGIREHTLCTKGPRFKLTQAERTAMLTLASCVLLLLLLLFCCWRSPAVDVVHQYVFNVQIRVRQESGRKHHVFTLNKIVSTKLWQYIYMCCCGTKCDQGLLQ